MSGKGGGSVYSNEPQDMKPQGLLHALSEIEQLSISEKHSPIPEGALTTIALLGFYNVGLKTALIGAVVTAILSPLMFAAETHLIPVFGGYEPTAFDRVFVVALTISFSLATSLLIFALLRKTYTGNVTRKAIHSLVGGLFTGLAAGSAIIFIVSHIVYYSYLTPEKLIYTLSFLPFGMSGAAYHWLGRFCENLIPGAYFQAAINVAAGLIILSSVILGRKRAGKEQDMEQMWE